MYVNAMNPMKEGGRREFTAFRREAGTTSGRVDPVAEILRRQRIPAYGQHLQEINGKKELGGR